MNNFKLTRESAIILVLFGAIILANPSMWWLIFVALGIVGHNSANSSDSETRESGDSRRQRREQDPPRQAQNPPRRDQRRSRRDDNPFREIGDELRRMWDENVTGTPRTDDSRYSNPTIAGRPAPRQTPRPSARPAPPAARDASGLLNHAVEAVEAAGHAPEDLALLPVDIGFIAYSEGKRPVRHREAPIPDTVNFIQPYIELRLQRPAAGTLRFEIVDGAGEVHYVREERRQLKAGRTPVIPGTRMPVGDFLYTDSNWSLRVYAAGTLIAEHHFAWSDPAAAPSLREHLAEDGELSADLAELVEDARLQPMSLDDLLSDQPAQASRRKG